MTGKQLAHVPNSDEHNIEFSARPESESKATVQRDTVLSYGHISGGALQRFVRWACLRAVYLVGQQAIRLS